MSPARPAGFTDTTTRSDRQLGLQVEEVDALRMEREPQLVVELRAHSGVDSRHHNVRARLDVEQDLGAERLDDVDHGVEAVVRRAAARPDAHVLRPDAYRNALASVRHE